MKRILALIIDGLINVVPVAAISLAISGELIDLDGDQAWEALTATTAWNALYDIGFLVSRSATPGKLMMGLYVGTSTGAAIPVSAAVVRWAVYSAFPLAFLPGDLGTSLLLFIGIVSIVMVVSDSNRRALHDRFAGTLVLEGKPKPGRASPDPYFAA